MGIRETMNKNPAITTGVTAGIIVLALIFIFWNSCEPKPRVITKAWYTVDDGQNWFSGDMKQVAPFMHEGKEAVKVFLFSCKGGKDPFPAYLERYTPEGKKKMEAFQQQVEEMKNKPQASGPPAPGAGGPMGPMMNPMMMGPGLTEVKKARDPNAKWLSMTNPQNAKGYQEAVQIRCPDGKNDDLVPVYP